MFSNLLRDNYYLPLPFPFEEMQEILARETTPFLKWNLELELIPK